MDVWMRKVWIVGGPNAETIQALTQDPDRYLGEPTRLVFKTPDGDIDAEVDVQLAGIIATDPITFSIQFQLYDQVNVPGLEVGESYFAEYSPDSSRDTRGCVFLDAPTTSFHYGCQR